MRAAIERLSTIHASQNPYRHPEGHHNYASSLISMIVTSFLTKDTIGGDPLTALRMILNASSIPTRSLAKMQDFIERLQEGLQIRNWKPDIVIKAFYDLDIVFFHGKLHSLTTMHWNSVRWWNEDYRSSGGYLESYGETMYLGNRKAAIHLNPWWILLNSRDAKRMMWSVVLHEMIHAYLNVMCGLTHPTSYDRSRG